MAIYWELSGVWPSGLGLAPLACNQAIYVPVVSSDYPLKELGADRPKRVLGQRTAI